MLNRLKSLPIGNRLLLAVFVFTAAFSALHLVKGVILLHVHLITGGFIFAAVSIPLVLICWRGRNSDNDGVELVRTAPTSPGNAMSGCEIAAVSSNA